MGSDGLSPIEWVSEYAHEHSAPTAKAPASVNPAGKPQAMAMAVAATGTDKFDSTDPGDAADQNFDGVYRCAHLLRPLYPKASTRSTP